MNSFKAPTGRISKMKADFFYRNGRKEDMIDEETGEKMGINRPWEYRHIKNLGNPKVKLDLKKEKVFDIKNDGKPVKAKKVPKNDKLKQPTMKNAVGKVFHYH